MNNVTFVALDSADAAAFRRFAEDGACSGIPCHWHVVDDAAELASIDTGTRRLVILYSPPWRGIVDLLTADGAPSDAEPLEDAARCTLERWARFHEAAISLTARADCTYVNIGRPVDVCQLLMPDSGRGIGSAGEAWVPEPVLHEAVLAELVFALSASSFDLYARIEAQASLFGREPEFAPEDLLRGTVLPARWLELLASECSNRRERAALETEVARALADRAALAGRIDTLEVIRASQAEERERLARTLTETNQARDRVFAELAAEQAARRGIEDRATALGQENDLLLQQLQDVQEECGRLHEAGQALQAELARRVSDINAGVDARQDLERRLARMHDEAELLLAQLRQVQDESAEQHRQFCQEVEERSGLQRRVETLAEENELFLAQLHQVQEELERYFGLYHQQTDALKRLQADYDAAARSITFRLFGWRPRSSAGATPALPAPKSAQTPIGRYLEKRKKKAGMRRQIEQIRQSGLFDEAWYRSRYPDVAASDADPIEHYIRHGAAEGRNPGPGFDTRWYLGQNPDVVTQGLNPLVHYIKFGRAEGRAPLRTIS